MNKSKNRSGMLIFEKRRKKLVYLRLTSLLHESDESDLVSASFELTARCVVFVATDFLQPDFWRSCPESDEEISALPEHWKLKLKKALLVNGVSYFELRHEAVLLDACLHKQQTSKECKYTTYLHSLEVTGISLAHGKDAN